MTTAFPGILSLTGDEPEKAASPTPAERSAAFVGVWAAADEDGDLFNVIVDGSGSAVSTWAKGKAGPRGERGYWQTSGEKIVLSWDTGWHDEIAPSRGEWLKLGYAPGTAVGAKPTTRSTVFRVREHLVPWVGVWESSSSTVSLAVLRSDGSAYRIGTARLEGRWVAEDGLARITWADSTREALVPRQGAFELVPIADDGSIGAGAELHRALVAPPTPVPKAPAPAEPGREDRDDHPRRGD